MCVCVCVYVLYRNQNRWIDPDKIWHRGGPWGREGFWVFFNQVPPTPGYRVHKGGPGCLWSLSHAFWQNLFKLKLQCTHDLVGEGHFFGPQIQIWKDLGPGRTWAPCPSEAMVTHYEGGPRGPKRGHGVVLEPQQCILAKTL